MVSTRFVRILVAASVAALVPLAGLAAPAAQADTWVDGRDFGLHVPKIADGVVPTVSYGTVRLWDAGVSWGQVERQRGQYWWVGLDHAVQAANAQNAQILYVLGSTPTWAAKHKSQGTYPNKGAASSPRSLSDWRRWVTAVVTRYGDVDRRLPDLERGQPQRRSGRARRGGWRASPWRRSGSSTAWTRRRRSSRPAARSG